MGQMTIKEKLDNIRQEAIKGAKELTLNGKFKSSFNIPYCYLDKNILNEDFLFIDGIIYYNDWKDNFIDYMFVVATKLIAEEIAISKQDIFKIGSIS